MGTGQDENFLIWPVEEEDEGAPGHGQGGKFLLPEKIGSAYQDILGKALPTFFTFCIVRNLLPRQRDKHLYFFYFFIFSNRVHESMELTDLGPKRQKGLTLHKVQPILSFVSKVSFDICIKVFLFSSSFFFYHWTFCSILIR